MTSQSDLPLKIDPSLSSAHGSSANDSGQSTNRKPPGSSVDPNDDPEVIMVWLVGGQNAHVKVQQGGKTGRWMSWENLWQSRALKWNQRNIFLFSLMLCFQISFCLFFLLWSLMPQQEIINNKGCLQLLQKKKRIFCQCLNSCHYLFINVWSSWTWADAFGTLGLNVTVTKLLLWSACLHN